MTVVATGLGAEFQTQKPKKVVDNTSGQKVGSSVNPDYNDLDVPTVIRERRPNTALAEQINESPESMEYLDVPAFLRRQAD